MIALTTYASFSAELRKIAAEEAPPKKKDTTAKKIVRGSLGGFVAPTVVNKALLLHALDPVSSRPADIAKTRRNVKNVAARMGVSDFDTFNNPAMGAAAGPREAMPGNIRGKHSHFVNIPGGGREATIAHELGHVRNLKRLGMPYAVLQGITRGTAIPGSAIASMYSAGKEDPTYTPGLVQAGLSAPMMGEELSANVQAARYMSKRYGVRKGLSKSKHLVPAMGTYAAVGLSPLAITAIRKKLRAKKQVEQAKVAAARELKKKVSGMSTADRDQFVQTLEDAPKTPSRASEPVTT